jgi:hypothetical protein
MDLASKYPWYLPLSKRVRQKVLLSEGYPHFTATVTSKPTNRRSRFIPSVLDYTAEPGSVKASSRQDAPVRGNHHPSAHPVIDMEMCLFTTPANQKNALIAQIFPSQSVLQAIASTVSITFAPGLWEILQAAAPPAIQHFKNLRAPLDTDWLWAIYLVLLEKPGRRPKIYIGSWTGKNWGPQTNGLLQARRQLTRLGSEGSSRRL